MSRILTASQLALHLGVKEIFSDVSLELEDRSSVGIVGPNGSGKTSLLRVLVGDLEPTSGSVSRVDSLRIGYVPQTALAGSERPLKEEVLAAFHNLEATEHELEASVWDLQSATEDERRQAERRYTSLLDRFEALGGYDYHSRMAEVAARLGLSAATLDAPSNQTSGGERTRAALAKALLSEPDLLVLDEPTNYLDFQGLAWLEGFLKRSRHAFIVVSHDRYFLDEVASEIWEIDAGSLQAYPGNYTKYRTLKAERSTRLQKEYERQQEYIAKQEWFISRYHAGQRSREARGRAKKLDRLDRLEAPKAERSVSMPKIAASQTGQTVLRSSEMEIGFVEDDQSVRLLEVPEMEVERGARIAILGSNGAGKTTLLRTFLGFAPPLAGSASFGHNVQVGYYRQGLEDLPEHGNVIDALLRVKNLFQEEARSYLARFLFRGDDVFKPIAGLSGGERSRLALARLIVAEPNVIILDEPTTHLDIPSREALEEVLISYEGTLIFVSHDRRFIALLAGQLWILEGGVLRTFAGPYEEWVRSRQSPASKPQPAKRSRQVAQQTKEQPAASPKPNQEPVIRELEATLKEVEERLGLASEQQDVSTIARLGEEYNDVRERLEQAWRLWLERDTSDE